MKQLLFVLILSIPFLSYAQNDTAIHEIKWVQGLIWEQIKEKAKEENKYIFVDCYTTWCIPCKRMEKEVYTNGDVASYFNENFVCVKIQMDTTSNDHLKIKKMYGDASSISKRYNVNSYPTYLFFSPDGNIVHREIGLILPNEFIKLGQDALTPNRQYYTLLSKFKDGKKDFSTMGYLARKAKTYGEDSTASAIAKEYMNAYLMKLNDNDLYTKENLLFFSEFSKSSKDKAFWFFYKNASKINAIIGGDDFAEGFISQIITQEKITPYLSKSKAKGNEPNWKQISMTIAQNYGSYYANRTVTWAKVIWYSYKKNWIEYTKNLVLAVEGSSPESKKIGFFINNNAWYVFERSNNVRELSKAAGWIEQVFQSNKDELKNPQTIDTYANLLYKIGRKKEAIDWEQKAVDIENENASKSKNEVDTTFIQTLEKMKKGIQTWPTGR